MEDKAKYIIDFLGATSIILMDICVIGTILYYFIKQHEIGLLELYIVRKKNDRIIKSRLNIVVLGIVLGKFDEVIHIYNIKIDENKINEISNKYIENLDINISKLMEEYRKCFYVDKINQELEDYIEFLIWEKIICLVLLKDFQKRKYILEEINIEKIKKYLLIKRYL